MSLYACISMKLITGPFPSTPIAQHCRNQVASHQVVKSPEPAISLSLSHSSCKHIVPMVVNVMRVPSTRSSPKQIFCRHLVGGSSCLESSTEVLARMF